MFVLSIVFCVLLMIAGIVLTVVSFMQAIDFDEPFWFVFGLPLALVLIIAGPMLAVWGSSHQAANQCELQGGTFVKNSYTSWNCYYEDGYDQMSIDRQTKIILELLEGRD